MKTYSRGSASSSARVKVKASKSRIKEMAARKHHRHHLNQSQIQGKVMLITQNNSHDLPKLEVESNQTRSSSNKDHNKYVVINLEDVHQDFRCPICLGIIRKTRTVSNCQHRFCKECIEKSMRLSHNECPACREHCASRRSTREDPNFDAMIALIFPDIDAYEEKELALHEDEKVHNKLIQDSISCTLRRQTEALGKKTKRRRNAKGQFTQASSDSDNDSNIVPSSSDEEADRSSSDEEADPSSSDEEADPSSSDEEAETKPKRGKKCRPSSSDEEAETKPKRGKKCRRSSSDEEAETKPKRGKKCRRS